MAIKNNSQEYPRFNVVEVLRIGGEDMYEVAPLEKQFGRTFEYWLKQPYGCEYVKVVTRWRAQEALKGKKYNPRTFADERIKALHKMIVGASGRLFVTREIFIEFARWLSPAFNLSCNLNCSQRLLRDF